MAVEAQHETSGTTVVVTGTHDPVAPALVRRLLRSGHRVVVPAPPLLPGLSALRARGWSQPGGPEVVEHDPEDPDVPAALAAGVDLVLHVAEGATPVAPVDGRARRGTTTLDALFALRVAETNGARLVMTCPTDDDLVAATLEGLLAGYRSAHDVDTVLVRVGECYGPGTPGGSGVVARMLTQARTTGRVVVDGRDERRHHPCFVDDVVDGLLRVALDRTAPPGGAPVELVGADGFSTAELAEQVCRATGADLRVVGLAPLAAVAGGPAVSGVAAQGPGLPEGLRLTTADDGPARRGGDGPDAPLRPSRFSPRVGLAAGLDRCVRDPEAAADASDRAATATDPPAVTLP
ncbi:NAD-dependent epimerase/dehydratase family protein [Jannaschia sp. R86511]|uniref:NAD-dependent epimerase/dehydratase family protein n=1 Tax=Jannaschia sp. R86511 TaxID=3093853 RepID=UPI0036D3CFA9